MNIGTILIATAMMLSAASAIFFLKSKNSTVAMQINTGRRLYYITTALILFTVILLLNALLNNEFQYSYVYSYSSTTMNIAYKIAALWAGTEGSYLIWLLILNLMGLFLLYRRPKNEDLIMTVVVLVQAMMLVILIVKSPFFKIWDVDNTIQPGTPVTDGRGMNPLLMDPWMVAHPPVLFLGYASSTIIFAFAFAALIRKEYESWISGTYKWVMFSMFTLGLGIFMGGFWAYKVLGWGGYWGWDPVENSSLVPWIVCVALMHSMMLQKRKPVLKRTNLGLALIYFILVFYSTFLTRSGVLSEFSVHSFQKSELKLYLGIILAVISVAAAIIYIRRIRDIKSEALKTELFNLENMTVFGIIVLLFYSVIILSGTSMPILSKIAGANPTPVTENFYNNISIPMGLMLLVFITLSAVTSIKYSRLILSVTGLLSVAVAAVYVLLLGKNPTAFLFLTAAVFLVQLTLLDIYARGKGIILSSRTAHLGIAVMIMGIIISGYYSWTDQRRVDAGTSLNIMDWNLSLKGYTEKTSPGIEMALSKEGRTSDIFMTYYVDEHLEPSYKEPGIISGITGDLYLIPQIYYFSSMSYGTEVLNKGEEKDVLGLKVRFKGFIQKNMGQPGMTILADLQINGKQYTPGWIESNGEFQRQEKSIGNTGRIVSVERIDVGRGIALIRISPIVTDKLPPDYVILDISFKRMIWLVWFGSLLISAGMVISMVKMAGSKS